MDWSQIFFFLSDAAHFVPPYVALTKSEDIVFKREPVVEDEDDDEEEDNHNATTHETDTKPMYLPQGLTLFDWLFQITPKIGVWFKAILCCS